MWLVDAIPPRPAPSNTLLVFLVLLNTERHRPGARVASTLPPHRIPTLTKKTQGARIKPKADSTGTHINKFKVDRKAFQIFHSGS